MKTRRGKFMVWGAILILIVGAVLICGHFRGTKPAVVPPPPESPYIAFARGRIDVEGGLVSIAAKKDGIIKDVRVEEGSKVKKDQILCLQDDIAERLNLDHCKALVAEADRKIEKLKVLQEAAQREQRRNQQLVTRGAIAAKEFDGLCDTLRSSTTELNIAEAEARTARANQAIAEYDIEQRVVRAPADGTILRCDVRPGYGTTSSSNVTRLFVFVPDLPFIVRAEVEEKFVRRIKPGMKAEVVPDADETKSYPATVLSISNYLGPKRLGLDDPKENVDVKTAECILAIGEKDLILQQRVLVKMLKKK